MSWQCNFKINFDLKKCVFQELVEQTLFLKTLFLKTLLFSSVMVVSWSSYSTNCEAQAKPVPANRAEANRAETLPAREGNVEIAKDATTEINVKNAEISAVIKIFSKKQSAIIFSTNELRVKFQSIYPAKLLQTKP